MTEDDIFKLLKEQEERLRQKPVFYVYYDLSSHKIYNIRNYIELSDSCPYIEMTQNDFDFSASDFNIDHYIVEPIDKKLKKLNDELTPVTTIDDYIYEIPKIISKKRLTYADKPFDLLIEQNNELKEFRIKLSKILREKFSLQSMNAQTMEVYVTEMNDPNILYKTLKFTFGELIQHEFYTVPFNDFNGNKVNIYAMRYFKDYIHVDVRND